MTSGTHWTEYEKILFEVALIMYPENDPDRWKKIATHLPGKSPAGVKEYYDPLVHDIQSESVEFDLLDYRDDVPENHIEEKTFDDSEKHILSGLKQIQSESEIKKSKPLIEDEQKADSENNILSGLKQNKSKSEIKKFKRGGRWTKDEHNLFLEGIKLYGWGNWTKIAWHFVTTRTPVQVKVHAHYHYTMHPEKDMKPSSSHGNFTDGSSQL